MRTKTIAVAITALLAAVVSGQAPADEGVDQVFHFTNTANPQDLTNILNLTRTLVDIQRMSADVAEKSIALRASAGQVALADWLFHELDASVPQTQNPAAYEYQMPDGRTDAVRVFYLTHDQTPQELAEIVNLTRTLADIQRMFGYTPRRAIAMRGTPDQIALAEWLFHELDKPAGTEAQKEAVYDYKVPTGATDAVRIMYAAGQTPQGVSEMVNLIRTIADVQRMFPYLANGAIALRGNAAQVALAEWLFAQLNAPAPQPPSPAAYAYRLPSGATDAVRVYRLTHGGTQQDVQAVLNAIRTTADLQRAFAYSPQKALALRGTDTQMAAAGRVIQELDK